MTAEGLRHIIANPEGTEIEYKKSQTALARTVYETISAFLNRKGGHVILGADNDGTILGINHGSLQEQLDTLAKDMNNPQIMSPTFYLNLEPLTIDGKQVIYFYVPESSQAHAHKGTYYDRNQDGDFALRNPQQIAELILRKQNGSSENRVLPYLTMDDLEVELFDDVRKRVRLNKANHLWATMTNEEILQSAGMRLKDPQTGREGYTLAAALLFGKEHTLTSVVPFCKIDALCRRDPNRLYDDRDTIRCNLMRAYDRLITFYQKHLPEWPHIEGVQRKSLRELILREVCLNLLIHREYGARHEATFTIYKDRIETTNWNIPYHYGHITPGNLRPRAKNPVIANFFSQLGIVEELGNGTRTMFKYVPLISGGKEPILTEHDEFRVTIPYIDEEDTPDVTPDVASDGVNTRQVPDKSPTSTRQVVSLVGKNTYSVREMMEKLELKDRENFIENYLKPSISQGLVEPLYPDNPHHPRQKYRLTTKGLGLLE